MLPVAVDQMVLGVGNERHPLTIETDDHHLLGEALPLIGEGGRGVGKNSIGMVVVIDQGVDREAQHGDLGGVGVGLPVLLPTVAIVLDIEAEVGPIQGRGLVHALALCLVQDHPRVRSRRVLTDQLVTFSKATGLAKTRNNVPAGAEIVDSIAAAAVEVEHERKERGVTEVATEMNIMNMVQDVVESLTLIILIQTHHHRHHHLRLPRRAKAKRTEKSTIRRTMIQHFREINARCS